MQTGLLSGDRSGYASAAEGVLSFGDFVSSSLYHVCSSIARPPRQRLPSSLVIESCGPQIFRSADPTVFELMNGTLRNARRRRWPFRVGSVGS
jgi:hypothetical protein